jgi:hypothetical protein
LGLALGLAGEGASKVASYQDLESRVKSLEDKLEWVMATGQMVAMVESAILNPDGSKEPAKKVTGSLMSFYRLSRQAPIEEIENVR